MYIMNYYNIFMLYWDHIMSYWYHIMFYCNKVTFIKMLSKEYTEHKQDMQSKVMKPIYWIP